MDGIIYLWLAKANKRERKLICRYATAEQQNISNKRLNKNPYDS